LDNLVGAILEKGKAMLSHKSGAFKQWIPIHSCGKDAGYVMGKTLYVAISGSKDMLHKPKAICFVRSTLQAATTAGATQVQVYDRDSHTTYATTIDTIDKYGFTGSGRHCGHIALPLEHWSIHEVMPDSKLRVPQQKRIVTSNCLFSQRSNDENF
jgi:hypothetical protein